MNDQAKIQRTLRLLMLLAGKRWYAAREIDEKLGISTRTLYRYLNTLEEAGLVVEKDPKGYRLSGAGSGKVAELLHFSPEEASLLFETLSHLKVGGREGERLLRKLHTLYDCHILARSGQQHVLQIGEALRQAMDKKVQVILKGYRSSHSGQIGDRLAEPFEMEQSGDTVWCFDPNSETNKQFKLSRIQAVELTTQPWKHAPFHQAMFTDAFGFSAPGPMAEVEIWLSLKAANLLKEEFPESKAYITEADYGYYFTGPIANWKGIGRFVKGMEGDVVVKNPPEFKDFLGW
jgi:predicted DNA-binding transcriptional regulator YafY